MYLLDSDDKVHNIDDSDIICIEVSRPHTHYRTKYGKFRAPRTLKEFNLIYEPLHFIQIDKKKIVKVSAADKIEDDNIFFDDINYPISRRKMKELKKIYDDLNNN